MVLDPVAGGVNGAIITDSSLTLTNSFTLNGNSGSDGDIIVNTGNFQRALGSRDHPGQHLCARRNGDGRHQRAHLWNGVVPRPLHDEPSASGDRRRRESSNNGTTLTNGLVHGRAYYCTGLAPAVARVPAGSVQTCSLGLPPSQAFPLIQFNATTWELQGYYVKDLSLYTCAAAINWVKNTGNNTYNQGTLGTTGGVPSTFNPSTGALYTGAVALMPSTCQFNPGNAASVAVNTNLAILASGGILLDNNTSWTSTSGTKNLFLMSPYNGTAASCPTQNVTVDTRNTFTNLNVSIYTPCTATVANTNGSMAGQVIGATVNISNQFTMRY